MKTRFPKGGAHKNSQEFLDADYLHKLSKKDREWYDKFIKAEYMADHTSAREIKGAELTKADKRRINAQNNRRVRDAHNKLDRSTVAQKALANSEKADEILDRSSEGHEE